MGKRVCGIFVISFLVLVLTINLIAAQSSTESLKNFGEEVFQLAKPIFEQILGGTPGGEYLFAKVLFLLILVSIIWAALSRIDFFSEYPAVLWIISIAASILAVRWIGGPAVIDTIILPYSALGITLSAAIPFVLFFILVEVGLGEPKFKTFRKIAWIFFAVVFIGLWLSRDASLLTQEGSYAGYIYPVTVLFSLIVLFMDGTIQKHFAQAKTSRAAASFRSNLITALRRELSQADEDFAKGLFNPTEHRKKVHDLNRKISALAR